MVSNHSAAAAHNSEMEEWFSRAQPQAMDRALAYWSQWWGFDLTRELTNYDKPRKRYGQ